MSYAQKKSIENVHIVRERDRKRFRELLAVFSIGLPVGLFLGLFTWQNLEVIRLARQATGLRQTKVELENANKRMKLELERLTSLGQVEEKVRRLGLAPVEPPGIVTVELPVDPLQSRRNGP